MNDEDRRLLGRVPYDDPRDFPEDREITVRLATETGLDQLLFGQYGCVFWLADNGDGTYSIHGAGVAGDDEAEAYFRVVLERIGVPPPENASCWPAAVTQPPTPEVRNRMERLRLRLGWGGGERE